MECNVERLPFDRPAAPTRPLPNVPCVPPLSNDYALIYALWEASGWREHKNPRLSGGAFIRIYKRRLEYSLILYYTIHTREFHAHVRALSVRRPRLTTS